MKVFTGSETANTFFYAGGNAATVYADYEYGVYTCGYVLIPLRNKDVEVVIKLVGGYELDENITSFRVLVIIMGLIGKIIVIRFILMSM